MNILIIEDDQIFAKNIKKVFEKKVVTNKITLLHSFEDFQKNMSLLSHYDIILVDIKLSTLDEKTGLDIIQIIRKKELFVPIIVIS